MSRTVTALYSTREEAEAALSALREEISLAHGEIYDQTPEATSALSQLDLTPEERESCERAVASGDHMLLAQVRSGEDPDHIVTVLEQIADRQAGQAGYDASPAMDASPPGDGSPAAPHGESNAVAEERVPIIEEELRVGTREVVRGGARVRTRVEEVPVQQEVELADEHTSIERRPVMRFLSEAELEQGGLLRERVVEVAQIREEAVVVKEAFVREEVLIRKTVDRRIEEIRETVRRTEVETEDLAPGDEGRFNPATQDRSGPFR